MCWDIKGRRWRGKGKERERRETDPESKVGKRTGTELKRNHGTEDIKKKFIQDTGVGCLSLLQGIFPTQESNPGLLHDMPVLSH